MMRLLGRSRRADESTAVNLIVSEAPDFDFLSEEYRSLFSRSSAAPFQSPLWLDRIYAELMSERCARRLIITIREAASHRLVGLIPLMVERYLGISVATFADCGVSDYCVIVAATEDLSSFRNNAALKLQLRRTLRTCDLLIVRKVREPELAAFDILGSVRRAPLGLGAHATALFGSFEDWRVQVMTPRQRRSLDKKRRSIERKGCLRTETIKDPDQIIAALDQIQEFRKSRFKDTDKRNLLDEERYFRFYCDVAHDPMCRAYVMTLDDRPVSIAYGMARNGRFHLLLTGFDSVNHRNQSLGLLVIEDAIRDCISRGDDEFDLTIGDQSYKRQFGTVETSMWWILCHFGFVGRTLSFFLARYPRPLALVRRFARLSGFRTDRAPRRAV
ncbi:GNAT family N-acetyltransferase [Rhodopseudomonas sp. HC1]|uniref:GNAT family N-acetyltransferase n=1 Tax=Rhodopseudomonas infernalis TaxID=2897386 RepID=UPI001EE83856|nr:GNAT family N-acetyltransferase [Rhodopseudomonas infernalis]MCG6203124.1 GNAT family N-acetyltransferase [Rhodopseudomonas infernalis]